MHDAITLEDLELIERCLVADGHREYAVGNVRKGDEIKLVLDKVRASMQYLQIRKHEFVKLNSIVHARWNATENMLVVTYCDDDGHHRVHRMNNSNAFYFHSIIERNLIKPE